MKKSVLVDIDDTLSDTQVKILEYVNKHSARQYAYEELNSDFREGTAEGYEYNLLAREFLKTNELVRTCPPYLDALTAIKSLHELGFIIHIASSRRENLHDITVDWLKTHGFIDFVTEIHPRQSTLRGVEFKIAAATKTQAVAAFDDTLDVVEALSAVVPIVYLIDKPWNQKPYLPPNVERMPNFADAVNTFIRGSNGR